MNHAHQLRFTSVVMVQMSAVLVAIAWFAYWESQNTMELVLSRISDFPVPSHEIHMTNQTFLVNVILLLACAAVVQVLFGIYASHKLAGPIVKMTQTLERARHGDFSQPIRFRSGDHLEELPVSINHLLEALSAEQQRHITRIADLEAAMNSLEAAPGDDQSEADIRAALEKLTGSPIPEPDRCAV